MVRRGALDRQDCGLCGEAKAEAHHVNYAQPLNVVWLCKACHSCAHRPRELGQTLLWLGA